MAKSAIVLDTNFMIEHISDLRELHRKLIENNDVYITEISINERISQKYLELKAKYDKIEEFQKDYSLYATVKLKDTFEKKYEADKQRTLESYDKEFGDYIIRFNPDEDALKIVLDRVYKKIPPFINKEKASDKGFKDTLMWMSILQHFRELDDNISTIFITNDNGFINSADFLQLEFAEVTGKTIEIRENAYYDIILGDKKPTVVTEEKVLNKATEINKQVMRERIEKTVESICLIETADYWGNEQIERTFSTNKEFDIDYIKVIFDTLKDDLDNHVFETKISANSILALDDRITNVNPIPMQSLEELSDLYDEIKNKYPEYIAPFFNAVCEILNRFYVDEHLPQIDEDEKMPF